MNLADCKIRKGTKLEAKMKPDQSCYDIQPILVIEAKMGTKWLPMGSNGQMWTFKTKAEQEAKFQEVLANQRQSKQEAA